MQTVWTIGIGLLLLGGGGWWYRYVFDSMIITRGSRATSSWFPQSTTTTTTTTTAFDGQLAQPVRYAHHLPTRVIQIQNPHDSWPAIASTTKSDRHNCCTTLSCVYSRSIFCFCWWLLLCRQKTRSSSSSAAASPVACLSFCLPSNGWKIP